MDKPGKQELMAWLEMLCREAMNADVSGAAVAIRKADGEVMTGYYNTNNEEKAILAYHIGVDAMFETIKNNIGEIREALEEEDAE